MKWRQALAKIREEEGRDAEAHTEATEASLPPACPPDQHFLPWNDDQVHQALAAGGLVWVWSRTLDEWVIWVLGERERAAANERHPYHAVYSLDELRMMTRERWTPEYLRMMHQAKRIHGGRFSC